MITFTGEIPDRVQEVTEGTGRASIPIQGQQALKENYFGLHRINSVS